MSKICFIGNSHLGCIKRAWDQMRPEYPGVKIDFFIDRSAGTTPLRIGRTAQDATELPDILIEEGKVALLKTGDYSRAYVFSMEFSIVRLASLYAGYRSDDQRPGEKQHLISRDFYHAAANAALKATRAAEVAKTLTKYGAGAVSIVEQPRPSEYITGAPADAMIQFRAALADAETIETMYRRAALTACGQLGVNLIRQPEETILQPMLSKGQYCLADIHDQSEGSWYARGDFIHMNPDYGRLVMTDILAKVGEPA